MRLLAEYLLGRCHFLQQRYYTRDALRKLGLCCHRLSVCLSACPSVHHVGAVASPGFWSRRGTSILADLEMDWRGPCTPIQKDFFEAV